MDLLCPSRKCCCTAVLRYLLAAVRGCLTADEWVDRLVHTHGALSSVLNICFSSCVCENFYFLSHVVNLVHVLCLVVPYCVMVWGQGRSLSSVSWHSLYLCFSFAFACMVFFFLHFAALCSLACDFTQNIVVHCWCICSLNGLLALEKEQ